ncbi:hypothetical protein FACS1894198_4680 [Clostridia bacterium]|nr:hypothetical protein FACS1894198_4680 [Clostridia bacterium]
MKFKKNLALFFSVVIIITSSVCTPVVLASREEIEKQAADIKRVLETISQQVNNINTFLLEVKSGFFTTNNVNTEQGNYAEILKSHMACLVVGTNIFGGTTMDPKDLAHARELLEPLLRQADKAQKLVAELLVEFNKYNKAGKYKMNELVEALILTQPVLALSRVSSVLAAVQQVSESLQDSTCASSAAWTNSILSEFNNSILKTPVVTNRGLKSPPFLTCPSTIPLVNQGNIKRIRSRMTPANKEVMDHLREYLTAGLAGDVDLVRHLLGPAGIPLEKFYGPGEIVAPQQQAEKEWLAKKHADACSELGKEFKILNDLLEATDVAHFALARATEVINRWPQGVVDKITEHELTHEFMTPWLEFSFATGRMYIERSNLKLTPATAFIAAVALVKYRECGEQLADICSNAKALAAEAGRRNLPTIQKVVIDFIKDYSKSYNVVVNTLRQALAEAGLAETQAAKG